jgi:hypothetical protein
MEYKREAIVNETMESIPEERFADTIAKSSSLRDLITKLSQLDLIDKYVTSFETGESFVVKKEIENLERFLHDMQVFVSKETPPGIKSSLFVDVGGFREKVVEFLSGLGDNLSKRDPELNAEMALRNRIYSEVSKTESLKQLVSLVSSVGGIVSVTTTDDQQPAPHLYTWQVVEAIRRCKLHGQKNYLETLFDDQPFFHVVQDQINFLVEGENNRE